MPPSDHSGRLGCGTTEMWAMRNVGVVVKSATWHRTIEGQAEHRASQWQLSVCPASPAGDLPVPLRLQETLQAPGITPVEFGSNRNSRPRPLDILTRPQPIKLSQERGLTSLQKGFLKPREYTAYFKQYSNFPFKMAAASDHLLLWSTFSDRWRLIGSAANDNDCSLMTSCKNCPK